MLVNSRKSAFTMMFTLGIALGLGYPAAAAVILGTSNAYAVSVKLTIVNATSGETATVSSSEDLSVPFAIWTAPAAGVEFDGANNVTIANPFPALGSSALFVTGVTEVKAGSTVDGGAGTRLAQALAGLENTSIGLTPGTPLTIDIFYNATQGVGLRYFAPQLQSTAEVSGDLGSLAAIGTTNLYRGSLAIGSESLGPFIMPSVNETITRDGVEIVFNEQVVDADANSLSLKVNAIRMTFNEFAINIPNNNLLVTGEIIVGHTEAKLVVSDASPVPEPATLTMFGLGALGFTGVALRRRKQAT